MKRIVLLSIVFAFGAKAAINKRPKDELARYRTEVTELGARLSTLEKEIGAKNNIYITSIEQIKQFESDVKLYRDELVKLQKQVLASQAENKKILHSYLLESENESTEEWQKKVHLELLKQAQTKLQNKQSELLTFQEKIAEFDEKLGGLRKNEEELAQMIKELEGRKKAAVELYSLKLEDKKKIESTVVKKSITARLAVVKKELSMAPFVQAKPDRRFIRPVDDYVTYTASPKGVTFKYQSVQPVKAAGNGKIVFAGDLASYGQVLLIDHGNDLRTVLLGKMNLKVKKNDTVKDGDIMAYTVNDSKDAQNLYFEVRKKNTAQNTILWLDLNGVSKI
ncbi:MAG TPA: peptidoglycan DD-metalloendopeptidase family protein [Bacteriovoracaceae bacterium]|nr:peptidoglycan DD-metalloendopeptidase family protein [Bacteriovoracaceae bacterium]